VQRLSGLSRRYVRRRWGRTALTGAGVGLGVAVLFTTLVVIASIDRGLDRLRVVSDGMDVVGSPVGGARSLVPDAAVDTLARTEDVDAVLRALSSRVQMSIYDDDTDSGFWTPGEIFGVDLAEVERFYPMTPREGRVFADGADEVVVSHRYATNMGLDAGDELVVHQPNGDEVALRITGIMDDRDLARRNDGDLLLTSLATARRLVDHPDGVSFVALRLDDGIDVDAWLAANDDVEPRFRLLGPDVLDSPLDDALANIGPGFTVYAALVLFVAVFLVFLTLSMAIAERQPTLGVLRILGASRADLFRLVVTEALVTGVLATAAGLALGVGFAAAVLELGVTDSDALGFPDAGLRVTGRAVVLASALGIGATLLGAYLPARRAARMAPLDAVREGPGPGPVDGTGSRRGGLVGAGLVGIGLALASRVEESAFGTGAVLFLLLGGAVLIVPVVLPRMAQWLGVVGAWPPARTARVAVPHLVRERARSAYTLGLAMAVLAMTGAMGAVVTSVEHTGDRQFAAQFSAGLALHSEVGVSDEVVDDLAGVPGVAAVATARWGRTEVRLDDSGDGPGTPTPVMAVDPDTWFDVSSFVWVAGDDDAVARRLAEGGAVVVPEYVARQVGARVRGTVVLDTRTGWRRFEIAGTYSTVGSTRSGDPTAAVVMSQADSSTALGLTRTTQVSVRLADGADTDDLSTIVRHLQEGPGIGVLGTGYVSTAAGWRGFYEDELDDFQAILRSIILPAALLSALGLANTLAVAMLERRREIGVLRAIGLDRRQASVMALIEASVQVGIAALLAVPLGFALSRPVVAMAGASIGTVFDYAYPWRWLAWVALLAFGLAVVASIPPAVRAARTDVGAAVRFE
jgi:putative ABC transport system permease protein